MHILPAQGLSKLLHYTQDHNYHHKLSPVNMRETLDTTLCRDNSNRNSQTCCIEPNLYNSISYKKV